MEDIILEAGMEFMLPERPKIGKFKIINNIRFEKHKLLEMPQLIISFEYCSVVEEISISEARRLINKGYWRRV